MRFGIGALFRLLIACAVAGVVLRLLNVNPRTLWLDLFDRIGGLWAAWFGDAPALAEGAARVWEYVLIGAVFVVPIWLAATVFALIFRRR